MEDQAELIRDEMKETRQDLGEKLETLEEKVTESVSAAGHAVSDTVESVKEGVQETVESVREALDISQHVREHPWLMVGGAVIVGYLAHSLLMPSRRSSGSTRLRRSGGTATSSPPATGTSGGSWMSEMFGSSWHNVQRFAAQTALDLVGRAAREVLPGDLGTSIGQSVDQMAEKLRDEPAQQPETSPA